MIERCWRLEEKLFLIVGEVVGGGGEEAVLPAFFFEDLLPEFGGVLAED